MHLKERDLSKVYDQLYNLAGRILSRIDACAGCPIQGCRARASSRHPLRSAPWPGSKTACCSGCRYTSSTGCTVEALGCKLDLCDDEIYAQYYKDKEKYINRLHRLKNIAHHYGLWLARASKEDTLANLHEDFWHVYHLRGKENLTRVLMK